MTRDEAIDTVQLVANSLGDMASVGISPAVDAKRLGADLRDHLIEALAALHAEAPPPAPPEAMPQIEVGDIVMYPTSLKMRTEADAATWNDPELADTPLEIWRNGVTLWRRGSR